MRTLLLVFLCWGVTFGTQRVSYEGYKVYQIHPKTIEHVTILKSLEEDLSIDFWSFSKGPHKPAVALVIPGNQEKFEIKLWATNIKWNILLDDVRKVIEQEQIEQLLAPSVDQGKISFTQYHRYGVIQDYVQQIATTYPSVASQSVVGLSTEGREITMLNICKDGCGSKPIIFMECAIHAREWIAPPMCLYVIQELVENSANAGLIKNIDWHIVPVMNVDGYEYTHTTARMWRKTRSPGTNCNGTDANRNFAFFWMEIGTSQNECSENFGGQFADSEPEVRAIEEIVKTLNKENKIKLYLAIHSYGQYILHPWGYTGEGSDQEAQLLDAGNRAAAAIERYAGTKYTVGSFYDALYPASGTSVDWVLGRQNINLSYTVELPGGGSAGFDLPPSRIDPVVRETFEGIKEFHKFVEENYV